MGTASGSGITMRRAPYITQVIMATSTSQSRGGPLITCNAPPYWSAIDSNDPHRRRALATEDAIHAARRATAAAAAAGTLEQDLCRRAWLRRAQALLQCAQRQLEALR